MGKIDQMFCTDCNEPRALDTLRGGTRCPVCGGARIVGLLFHQKTKVGDVKVNFTFGRIGAQRR